MKTVTLIGLLFLVTCASAGTPELKHPKKAPGVDKSMAKPAVTSEMVIGACTYNFQYDAAKHSEEQVKGFARFSPASGEWMNTAFEQWVPIGQLKSALPSVPPTLKPVLECYLKEHSFYLELAQRQEQFAKAGEISVLKKPIFGIDPVAYCKGKIDFVAKEKPSERAKAVNLHWHNCINDEFRKRMCSPSALWQDFLRVEQIKEIASNCEGGSDD